MKLEKALEQFLAVNWDNKSLYDTKQKAKALMDEWKGQNKVPGFKELVESMETKDDIIMLLWRAINSGLKYFK